MRMLGNIFGQLGQKTQGECIKGALQDEWQLFETFTLPVINKEKDKKFEKAGWDINDKYVLGKLGISIWSSLRDMRLINQTLMDTILEPEYVKAFRTKMTVDFLSF